MKQLHAFLLPVLCLLCLAPPEAGADSLRFEAAKGSRLFAECSSTAHDFVAEVDSPTVTVETSDDAIGVKSAKVSFTYDDVKTGDGDRDKDMRKRFNGKDHPAIVYTVESFVHDPKAGLVAKGNLEWNGRSRALDIPVKLERKGSHLRVEATFRLDHRDWGLEKIRSYMFFTVDPELAFTVKLEGELKRAEATGKAR